MGNPFVDIVRTARKNNWCTMPYCTTCGAEHYRNALRQLGGELGNGLAKALSTLDPSELTKEYNWRDALRIAVMDLPRPLYLEALLEAWWPKFYDDIDFSDFVIFRIVRYMPEESDIRKRWINSAVASAKEKKHFSLTESLLLVLRASAFQYPELMEIAKRFAESSSQMRRVLRNACGIDLEKL
jgi:hypothetical protein